MNSKLAGDIGCVPIECYYHEKRDLQLLYPCRLLVIDVSVNGQPGVLPGVLPLWNLVVLTTITIAESAALYFRISLAHLKPCHDDLHQLFYQEKKFAVSTVHKSYQSWTIPMVWVLMHFANHYTKFQWKQSRQLTVICQFLSHGLPGLSVTKKPLACQSPGLSHTFCV